MKRNFSAKSTGLKSQQYLAPNLGISDSEKTQFVKIRLFDRGLSSNPLPSVPRPKVSQSSKRPNSPNPLLPGRIQINDTASEHPNLNNNE